MTIMMSDLSRDLAEEVLIRVPLTCLRAVRLTCKEWNNVSKDGSAYRGSKEEASMNDSFEMIMVMDDKVYLMTVDLHSNVDPSITRKGTLFSLKDDANHHHHHQVVDILRVFHCDGLLLCITRELNFRLVVWNPYFGETRWIQPRDRYHIFDNYALGYDEKKKCKILRFVDEAYAYREEELYGEEELYREEERICELELYSFESDSWKVVLNITPDS